MNRLKEMFNTVQTYDVALNSNNVQEIYDLQNKLYILNPFNAAFLRQGPSIPSYTPTFEAVTGPGSLMLVSNVAANCVDGSSAYNVWITNIVANVASNGMMNVKGSVPSIVVFRERVQLYFPSESPSIRANSCRKAGVLSTSTSIK